MDKNLWNEVGPDLLAALQRASTWMGREPNKSDMALYAQARVQVINAIERGEFVAIAEQAES